MTFDDRDDSYMKHLSLLTIIRAATQIVALSDKSV